VREIQDRARGDYHTLIRCSVKTDAGGAFGCGSLFSTGTAPRRTVRLKVEAELTGHMTVHRQRGRAGLHRPDRHAAGETGVNIGTFHLGRRDAGGEAVLLLSVDRPGLVPRARTRPASCPGVKRVMSLRSEQRLRRSPFATRG
jgi:D-3-phosphoglycerate dehydrogenase